MQNISRRVFIKGMAVAAVATAASTVLAGCNFVPGTEEAPVTGFTPDSKTLTVGEKSFTVNTTAMASGKTTYAAEYNDLIVVSLSVVNKLEKAVNFQTGSEISVKAYVDDTNMLGKEITLQSKSAGVVAAAGNDNMVGMKIATDTDAVSSTTKGNLYFLVDKAQKDWKKLNLVFTLNIDGKTETATFVINR